MDRAPGYEVIDTLQKEIPGLDLVAEDLGLLRPEVLMLKDHYHLKGMKILLFSIETGGKYARDTFHDVENMIFYTGTHDNDTIMQWYGNMSAAARRKIRRMLKKAGASQGSVKDRFLQYTMQNQAEYAIIPLADILGLGKEGHINTPGTIGSPNWEWHLPDFIQAKKELQKFWQTDRGYKAINLLLFTHHYPARCFGMNMPKSRDIQAKIPLP
mgnify:CR=1 FL=1